MDLDELFRTLHRKGFLKRKRERGTGQSYRGRNFVPVTHHRALARLGDQAARRGLAKNQLVGRGFLLHLLVGGKLGGIVAGNGKGRRQEVIVREQKCHV